MSDEEKFYDTIKFGYPIGSATLCLVGTLANISSLTFFILKKQKSIGDKLLMLLNTIDLLLCLTATTLAILLAVGVTGTYDGETGDRLQIALIVVFVFYMLLIDGTGFSTCLLSVTRAVGIAFPFYRIRGKRLVVAGIIGFILFELSAPAMSILGPGSLLIKLLIAKMVSTALMIFVVVISSAFSAYKLMKSDVVDAAERHDSRNRKATWTVIILSAFFFIFNSGFLAVWATLIGHANSGMTTSLYLAIFFGLFFAIPLNSAINPIVYLVRRSDMQQFFK